MNKPTSFMGSCHGQTSSSQPSNWPEKVFLFLKSKVDTSGTSIRTRRSHYGILNIHKNIHIHDEHRIKHFAFLIGGIFSLTALCWVFRKLYSDKDGKLMQTGDIVKFEKLADTLEMIANRGADAFYTGRIAEDLIRDIQEAGIVRRVSSYSLSGLFSISAWHADLITNEQINWGL